MCAIRKLPASSRALYVTRKPPEARQHAPRVRSPLIDDPSHSLTRMHPSSARPLHRGSCGHGMDGAQPSTRAPAARPPLSAVRAHLEPLHGDAHPLAAVANNWLALAATRRKTASLSDKFRSTFGSKRQKAEGPSFQIWLLSHSSFELTPSTHIGTHRHVEITCCRPGGEGWRSVWYAPHHAHIHTSSPA